ncbi:hypothetical protein FXF51_20350 [Nonomuraea sp. PA05]|uniref:hypothetical protein n=1 Tax=Nonomuraea sp. PA05 TaxID=2604466 RepID=UPI0011D2F2F2|nr:hypothetical protein [Nonomuraea sp. PA05]TYB64806.1 hypothetical protein FXF51_20350 [Nonomuraea sp. PA05]
MTTAQPAPPAAALDVDPFTALAVHFGMLLGVSDFQVLAANPRGKAALHQAWLHGRGVVWGFPVSVAEEVPELVVGAGLAVDGLGREVATGSPMCLDVHAWLGAPDETSAPFDARLVVRHEACLSRPVPSIQQGYAGSDRSPAYSRILEMARLELKPYTSRPPDDRAEAFPALRRYVRDGLLPEGADHRDTRLAEFREVLARHVATLRPPGHAPDAQAESTKLFPEDEPGEVLLADLPGMRVVKVADRKWRLEAPVVDLSVRRTHMPTWMLSELLAELLDRGSTGSGRCASDAGGPRVRRIRVAGTRVTVEFRGRVVEATVWDSLGLYPFDQDGGWGEHVPPAGTRFDDDGTDSTIAFDLPEPAAPVTYRLVLSGTGAKPLAGLVNGQPVPLAGLVGDPPASRAQGRDVARRLVIRPAEPLAPEQPTESGGPS